MKSAVKQHPRNLFRLLGRWASLSCLLMAIPAWGQKAISQPETIRINDATLVAGTLTPSKATPYPSSIVISNQLVGAVQGVDVVLKGVTHTYANDVDVLLVSPTGKKIKLMSDVGLNHPFSGVDLTLTAPANASPLPAASAITSGKYATTDYSRPEDGADDVFAAPAPSGPWSDSLADLVGVSPVGTWQLFVMDDKRFDEGTIAGWELRFHTAPVFGSFSTNNVVTYENIAATFTVSFTDSSTAADAVVVKATSADTNLVANGNISVSTTGTTRTITALPSQNRNGATTIEVTISDGITTIANTVPLTVLAVNQPPAITLNTNAANAIAGGFVTSVIATNGDPDTPVASISVIARSANTSLVPTNFVVDLTGTGATRQLLIAPLGGATGTTTLEILARDNGTSNNVSSPKTLSFTVSPVTQPLAALGTNIAIPDNGSVTNTVTLSGVYGKIGRVVAGINGLYHDDASQVRAVLRGPGGAVALLNGNGGANTAGAWLALDDTAANPLPNPLSPGVYRPAAPLSVFANTDANGTWALEVSDLAAGGTGSIRGGFNVRIFTAPVVQGLINTNLDEGSTKSIAFTVGDYDGTVTNVTVASSDASILTATVTGSGNNRVLNLSPVADKNGVVTLTITARDDSNYTGAAAITVTVNPVNTAPIISPIPKQVTYAGIPIGPIPVTVHDNGPSGNATDETAAVDIVVTGVSGNSKFITDKNIVIGGSGANRTITLYPTGNQEGEVTITIHADDKGVPLPSKRTSTSFTFQILPPGSPLFQNPTSILIADSGTNALGASLGATNAAPYPSPREVTGVVGLIRKTRVTLTGVKHPSPQDLGVLLVGPGSTGAKVMMMSGSGGATGVDGATLIFEDSGGSLPGVLASGRYAPSNIGGLTAGDFPDTSSSVGSLSAGLSVFNGTSPNGTWNLYVRDFTGNSKGDGQWIEGGWMISFETDVKMSNIGDQTTDEDTAKRVTVVIGDEQPGLPLSITATSDAPGIVPNDADHISIVPGNYAAREQVLTLTPASNMSGTANITVTSRIDLPGFVPETKVFKLTVNAVNDEPIIGALPERSSPAGLVAGPWVVNATDVESAASAVVVTATSEDQALVPNENIKLERIDTAGNWNLLIVPNGTATGSTKINVQAQVGTERPSTKQFTFNYTRNRAFANDEGRIVIRDSATAQPYPSVTRVSGMSGAVSKVSVTLMGLMHPFPDDIDMVLVSPDGSKAAYLMADIGGGAPTNSLTATTKATITFADAGQAYTEAGGVEPMLKSWTYKPAAYGSGIFPSGPSSGIVTNLAVFNGVQPNGEWKLYIVDDTFSDAGEIEKGWILVLETSPTIADIGAQSTDEDITLNVPVTVSDSDTDADKLTVWATSLTQSLVNDTNLVITPTNTYARTLAIKPTLNQNGTNLITVYVTDGSVVNSKNFALTVRAVDDAPVVNTGTNLVVVPEDTQTNIVFAVSDVDSVLSVTNVTVTSSLTSIVPNDTNNIIIAGPVSVATNTTDNMTVTVKPALNAVGDTTLTFSMRDASGSTTKDVVFRTIAVNDAPTISTVTNRYEVLAGGTVRDIPVTVGDVETTPRDLTFTAVSKNTAIIPDINVVTGGSGANRLLTVTAVGNGTGIVPIELTVRDGDGSSPKSTTITLNIEVLAPAGKVYANTGRIDVRDNNSSAPYPSSIPVSGLQGKIHRVSLTIDGITHSVPDDIDALLVQAPLSGSTKKVMVLSDAGGTVPVFNTRLEFRDDAAGIIPDAGPMEAGSYRVSSYQDPDVMPGGAPAGPYSNSFADFLGADPNGTWSLYIADDTAGDTGSVTNGWAVTITTTPVVSSSSGSTIAQLEDATATVNLTLADPDTPDKELDKYEFVATSTHPSLIAAVTPTLTSANASTKGGPWTFSVAVVPVENAYGTNLLTVGWRRKVDGAMATVQFAQTVTLQNDAPTISRITERQTDENVPLTFRFVVSDVDTDISKLDILGTSDNATLIPSTSILFLGSTNKVLGLPSSEVSVTLVPAASQTGTAQITFTVTDNSTNAPAQTATTKFVFRVTAFNDPPVIAAIPDLSITAGDSSTNVLFAVTDVEGSSVTVKATSSDTRLIKDENIKIYRDSAGTLPGGGDTAYPPGPRYIKVTSEAGRPGVARITVTANDGGKDAVPVSFNVNLTESRERGYANTAPIVIRDNSSGLDYPSSIVINDLVGNVTQARVRLNGFAHSFPSDTDILLVSPNGKKVMLMSDAGGGQAVTNVTLTLKDNASDPLPPSERLTTGEYKPKNYDPADDPMAAPAPAAPYAASLAEFNGGPAQGTWKLYVVDDTPSDSGFINGGWELFLTTQPRIVGLADLSTSEDNAATMDFTVAEEAFAGTDFTCYVVSSTNTAVVPTNNVVLRGNGTNWSVAVTPAADMSGSSLVTIAARNNQYGGMVTGSFKVNVSPLNDPPYINTSITNLIVLASGTASPVVEFTYGDAETPRKDLTLSIASSNEALIPTNNVVILGGTISVAPVGAESGESDISIVVSDPEGARTTLTFKVVVLPVLHEQMANDDPVTIPTVVGSASPYPSLILVEGVAGKVSRVTVTLAGLTHGYPADLDVLLVGPHGQKVLLMSDAGGSAGLENARFTLDDSAAATLPFNPSLPMTNGTYKPSNYGGSPDDFPGAPEGPVSSTLAAFQGTDPNGTWSLYIRDTFAGFGGTLAGGWILNIYTTEPTISEIADQVTDENVPISVNFQIADADTALADLAVRAGSEAPELFDVALSGSGSTRTLTITPVPYAYGEGQATVAVTDGTGVATTRFKVTVRPVNQAPEILGLSDQVTPSNRELRAEFFVTDKESAGSDLQVTATLLRPEFGVLQVTGSDTNRWLVFQPAGEQGQTFVTVVASDGLASTTNVISIVVGAPYELAISPIPAQSVPENGSVTVGFTVSGSDSGNVSVVATAADPELIASVVTAGSGSSWTVKITAADDVAGVTKVALVATDEFGTGTAEIDVTIVPSNDPPVFGAIPNQSTLKNQAVTFDIPISDKDTAVSSLVWTWASSNPELINNVVFGERTGGVPIATVFPKRDQVGQASVTLFADDGSTKVGAPVLVTVTAPPNEPPVFGSIPDQTTTKNIPLTIELPISDPDTAIVDIVMTGVSSNQEVVRNVLFGIKNGTTITATLRPVTDATGLTRVTITADDGATKVSQSFNLNVTQPPNEPPVFGAIADQTVQSNDRPTITLDITDPDTAISSLILTGVSSNPSLVVGFDFDQTGVKPTVTLLLGKDKTGIAVVTITADDGKSKVSQSFALQVTEASTPELAIPTVTRNPDGTLTVVVTWENGGELEWSVNVTGPWIKTGNTSGRYTEITAQSRKMYRVSR